MASQEKTRTRSSNPSKKADKAPLWNYVTKLEKQGKSGGTWKYQCNLCKEIRHGSYSRVKAHLPNIARASAAGCVKVTSIQRREMERLEAEFDNKKKKFGPKEVLLHCETSSKEKKSDITPLERQFNIAARDQLDQEIGRMFYTGGLPFNLARNPHYYRSYQFAAKHSIDGYVPPGYNKIRTTLLDKEENNVKMLMESLKATWKEKGVTIAWKEKGVTIATAIRVTL